MSNKESIELTRFSYLRDAEKIIDHAGSLISAAALMVQKAAPGIAAPYDICRDLDIFRARIREAMAQTEAGRTMVAEGHVWAAEFVLCEEERLG